MRDRFARVANDLLAEDPHAAVVLAEISLDRFAERLSAGDPRVVNVGIMEQAMVGVAAGFALEGFRPIVHTIAPFLTERALEQVKLDLGYQRLAATLVAHGGSYDYGTEGTTHHAPGDVQALLSIPGIEIAVPGHPDEVETLLRDAHGRDAVSYVRLAEQRNADPRPVVPGKLHVIRHGAGPVVLAVGPMLDRTLTACAGLDATIAYVTTVTPFDADGLRALVAPGATVIAVGPFHEGTMAFLLSEALADRPSRIVEIGVPRRTVAGYGTVAELDAPAGLDAGGIARRVRRVV